MYASVAVLVVVGLESREHFQLDLGSISVFLDRPDNLNSDILLAVDVMCKDNFAEGSLS
jgi:hypothetical protein